MTKDWVIGISGISSSWKNTLTKAFNCTKSNIL